jgi:hypothetical protein
MVNEEKDHRRATSVSLCGVEMAMGTRNPKPDGFLPH